MCRLHKIQSLLGIADKNERVSWLMKSKQNYESICKEIDDVFIEIENENDGEVIDKIILRKLPPLKLRYESSINLYTQNEIAYGNLERDDSIIKQNRFNSISEELIMKAMNPLRLIKHLELGGVIDDF